MQELEFVVLPRGRYWYVEANGRDCGVAASKERALEAAFHWAQSSYDRGYLVSIGRVTDSGELQTVWWLGMPATRTASPHAGPMETVVPGPASVVVTEAPSCWASAVTIPVPRPGFPKAGSFGMPTPSSLTVSVQPEPCAR